MIDFSYIPFILIIFFSTLFCLFLLFLNSIVSIKPYILQNKTKAQYLSENKEKVQSYECGLLPIGQANIQFDIKFFKFILVFILLEVEIICLFPIILNYEIYYTINNVIKIITLTSLLIFNLALSIKNGLLNY